MIKSSLGLTKEDENITGAAHPLPQQILSLPATREPGLIVRYRKND